MELKKPEDAVTDIGGVVTNPGEVAAVAPKSPPWFRPKKGGVIPPKRELVKTMILKSILRSIATLFRRRRNPSTVGEAPSTPPPPVTPNGSWKKGKFSDSA